MLLTVAGKALDVVTRGGRAGTLAGGELGERLDTTQEGRRQLPLRRSLGGRWGGVGSGQAQGGQTGALFAGERVPGALLAGDPDAEVVAVVDDAGGDVGQPAVGFVGGEAGQDTVVTLPVRRPGAVPVLVDRRQLSGTGRGPVGVLAQGAGTAKVGEQPADRDRVLVALAAWSRRRPQVTIVYLCLIGPLATVFAVTFLSGRWTG
ncbi:hypothetical protein ACF1CG_10580 [Streptomyces sp. NPDC014773]|uniref:hypothetical protein n=1 Tax=Streptomyces sp. NPDC014773 TaxID=3364908 RepID=UPI0037015FAB